MVDSLPDPIVLDSLGAVSVRVEQEPAVVVLAVLRARARCAVVAVAGFRSDAPELVHVSAREGAAKPIWLEVVAEGVETQEAWDALREQGCTLAQGYFIGRPIPADELAALLEELAPRTGPEPLAVAETG
jgi:hypothetical protein